jgi:hypothetical protein
MLGRLIRNNAGQWTRVRKFSLKTKERQLRGNLIRKYGKCILTGWSNPLEYQAAHIVPRHVGYSLNFPHVNSDENCILLTNTLHTIFDDMVWTFNMKDAQPVDHEYFTTGILVRDSYKINESILSLYAGSTVSLPSAYIPSLYLHYRVFLDQGTDDIKNLYQGHIKSRTYKKLIKASCADSLNIIKKSQ